MTKNKPKILIGENAMEAVLQLPLGLATDLTEENLKEALYNANIRIPLPDGLLAELVSSHNAGKKISGTIIAKGQAATSAAPGELAASGDLNFPVFPGDEFGVIKPPASARNGINVFGEMLLPPPAKQKVKSLRPSSSGAVALTNNKLIAMLYGLVYIENDEINIRPLLRLSKDLMALSATIYPKDFLNRKISLKKMVSAVNTMGLRGRPSMIMLEEGIEKAQKTNKVVEDLVICHGLKPIRGEDGWLELLVEQKQKQKAGAVDASGNIDYKQRGTIKTVRKNEVLAILHPPSKGRPGRNLLGNTIPGEDGNPCFVKLGENVAFADKNNIIATTGGLLIANNNEISVSEVYVIKGDVGLRTGHIALDKGSIMIQGSVLSGFHVTCPGNIYISGTVEDAILIAGGNIDINGGIVMNNNGLVRAFGSVSALFAVGTNIHAGENVHITNEINKSTIIAEDSIIVTTGKGKVVGGTLHCGKTIKANLLGSELGAPTELRLGIDETFLKEYQKEHSRLTQSLDFIKEKIGLGSDEQILERYAEEKTPTVQHILTIRTQLSNRVNELAKNILRLEEHINKPNYCSLEVTKTIFPGITVYCQESVLPIRSPLMRSKITYDPNKRGFQITSL